MKRKERINMSADNGTVSNVQDKTFDGLQKTFEVFLFYFRALLMTKDLLDVLLPEVKKRTAKNCTCQRPNNDIER